MNTFSDAVKSAKAGGISPENANFT